MSKTIHTILLTIAAMLAIFTGLIFFFRNQDVSALPLGPLDQTQTEVGEGDADQNQGGSQTVSGNTIEKEEGDSEAEADTNTDTEKKPSSNHDHTYKPRYTTEPTCTMGGVITYTCGCGDSYVKSVASPGHVLSNWRVVKEAAINIDGLRRKSCEVCGIVLVEESIPFLLDGKDHQHQYMELVETASACKTGGVSKFTCSQCKATYTRSTEATGHLKTQTKTEKATCAKEGLKTTTCVQCSEVVKTVTLDKIDHELGEWTVDKEATSTATGLKVKKCKVCKAVIEEQSIPKSTSSSSSSSASSGTGSGTGSSSSSGKPSSSTSGSTSGGGGGGSSHTHTYTSKVEKEPTCTDAGQTKYSCTCGSYYTEGIVKLGHKQGEWIVTKEPQTYAPGMREKRCTVCNVVLITEEIPKLK